MLLFDCRGYRDTSPIRNSASLVGHYVRVFVIIWVLRLRDVNSPPGLSSPQVLSSARRGKRFRLSPERLWSYGGSVEYRGASRTRKRQPLGPCSSPMLLVLQRFSGVGGVL